jgi:hypothetical protein
LSAPSSTGGLVPKYNAEVVNNVGDLLTTPYTDISLNITYTTSDLSANVDAYVSAESYVLGPDSSGNTKTYYSVPPTTVLAGLTKAVPEINRQYIDVSGILWFTTNNNGSPLNFIEAIIVDTSGVLNLSLCTDVSGDVPETMTIVENTSLQALIKVNFNDPDIPRPQNTDPDNLQLLQDTLIVVANIRGANAYNTL